jgi:surfeit locus 1 family protein
VVVPVCLDLCLGRIRRDLSSEIRGAHQTGARPFAWGFFVIRHFILPALFGLLGTGILVSLGMWQLDRAGQKAALIAEMEERIFDAPIPLPAQPNPDTDRYRPVRAEGRFLPDHSFVLAAQRDRGPGFHLISVLETDDGRRVLVDRGFLREADRPTMIPESGPVQIVGNLHWPRDTNRFTPSFDAGRNLFFGRDVGPLMARLGTEPVLIILRASDEGSAPTRPVPVDQVSIPDNHLGYAVQWFLMALAWAGMTLFFLWRMGRQKDQDQLL